MKRVLDGLRRASLTARAEGLVERMDRPDCDRVRLDRTYRQFAVVNQLLSGWDALYARRLRPVARRAARARGSATLLDVGCGGGDLARRLALLASRDDLPLRITAVDPEPRALSHARSRATPPGVEYLEVDAEALADEGRAFDLVVSNHVLHHLESEAVPAFLDTTGRLARGLALHNDIRRSPLALPAFAAFSLPFRGSFIAEDGLRSIRRSFTPSEAAALAPDGWRVETMPAFRLLLLRETGADA